MLSTKKLLYKMLDTFRVKTATRSGTTNAQGALSLVMPDNSTVLTVACTNNTNAQCYSWLYDGHIWYVQVRKWSDGSFLANEPVSLTIRYLGGVACKSVIARLSAFIASISERRWAVC